MSNLARYLVGAFIGCVLAFGVVNFSPVGECKCGHNCPCASKCKCHCGCEDCKCNH